MAFSLVICAVGSGVSFAQTPPPAKQQNAPKQKTETFWHKVLRVSGIAESPSTLKGPGDEVDRGQIWIADSAGGKSRKLTNTGGFRSPVFIPGGNAILALKGTDVVRVSLADGKVTALFPITRLIKLVGFSMDDPDQVLTVTRDGSGQPGIAFLSVSGAKLVPLPYDPDSMEDRHMVEHLSGWDRNYGETSVYINQQTKTGMSGTLSWTDVFLRKGSGTPMDVSNCASINCGQPSLSPNGKLVAFVKSEEE